MPSLQIRFVSVGLTPPEPSTLTGTFADFSGRQALMINVPPKLGFRYRPIGAALGLITSLCRGVINSL